MFSKIVLLAVVALAVAVAAKRPPAGSAGAPADAAKSGAPADAAKGGEKKDGIWRKAKECCPSMKITMAGAWKECNNTASVTCKSDCVFDKSGLLSADKQSVDLAAVNAKLDTMTTWSAAAIADAKTKCTTTPFTVKPNNEKKCVTAAQQTLSCIMKTLLPTCPDASAATADCQKVIKEMAEKSALKDAMKEKADAMKAANMAKKEAKKDAKKEGKKMA